MGVGEAGAAALRPEGRGLGGPSVDWADDGRDEVGASQAEACVCWWWAPAGAEWKMGAIDAPGPPLRLGWERECVVFRTSNTHTSGGLTSAPTHHGTTAQRSAASAPHSTASPSGNSNKMSNNTQLGKM
ncbi:hypothetical protein L1887_57739 [Cichorium endivia]|nr:hypothetical protein L1887_57739 [Cichorium endivia]